MPIASWEPSKKSPMADESWFPLRLPRFHIFPSFCHAKNIDKTDRIRTLMILSTSPLSDLLSFPLTVMNNAWNDLDKYPKMSWMIAGPFPEIGLMFWLFWLLGYKLWLSVKIVYTPMDFMFMFWRCSSGSGWTWSVVFYFIFIFIPGSLHLTTASMIHCRHISVWFGWLIGNMQTSL